MKIQLQKFNFWSKRFLSLLSLFFFTAQSVLIFPNTPQAFAQTIKPLSSRDFQKVNQLPSELGKVETLQLVESKNQSSRTPLVIHIRDAHGTPSAQRNVAQILQWLHEKYPNLLVGIEGAKGKIRPDYFELLKGYDKENQSMVDAMIDQGDLSGAEYFAWNQYQLQKQNPSKTSAFVFGIEDVDLYRQNLDTYRKFLSERHLVDSYLRQIQGWAGVQESKHLSSEVREFLRDRDRLKEGRYRLGDSSSQSAMASYLELLRLRTRRYLQIDLNESVEQLRFPHLIRWFRLRENENAWNSAEALEAWKKLTQLAQANRSTEWEQSFFQTLDLFVRKHELLETPPSQLIFMQKHNAERLRKLAAKIYRFCEIREIAIEEFEPVLKQLRLLILSTELDLNKLLKEIQMLENQVFDHMVRSDDEKMWVKRHEQIKLLEKLFYLKLSHDDFIEIAFAYEEMSNWIPQVLETSLRPRFLEMMKEAIRFYQTAKERDGVMFQNAMKEFQRRKQAQVVVLIAGGFHSEGIAQALDQSKYSYAILQPQFKTSDPQNYYEEVMAGKHADLSKFVGTQNPFGSKRESLLFRMMLEVGIPMMLKSQSVSGQELTQTVGESLAKNPLFAMGRRIRLVNDQATSEPWIHLSPDAPEAASVAQFTVASPAVGSEINLEPSFPSRAELSLTSAGRSVVRNFWVNVPAAATAGDIAITQGDLRSELRQIRDLGAGLPSAVSKSSVDLPNTTALRGQVEQKAGPGNFDYLSAIGVVPSRFNVENVLPGVAGYLTRGSSVAASVQSAAVGLDAALQELWAPYANNIKTSATPIRLGILATQMSPEAYQDLTLLSLKLFDSLDVILITKLMDVQARELQQKLQESAMKLGLDPKRVQVVGAANRIYQRASAAVSGSRDRQSGLMAVADEFGLMAITRAVRLDATALDPKTAIMLSVMALQNGVRQQAGQDAFSLATFMTSLGITQESLSTSVGRMVEAVRRTLSAA